MAERALPPGTIRRRTAFGLLDADGWAAAFLKALFWFLLILFMLGYIPDRAYYFTVSNTLDVGYNAIPLVNFCDPSNKSLPCPAPPGAIVPWEQSPPELALPEPRAGAAAVQSGTNLYLVGGEAGGAATAETLATTVTTDGNFAPWTDGPALPAARSGMAVATLAGVPYVIGGLDESGAPTDTVYVATLEEGAVTGWQEANGEERTPALQLPVPISGAAAAATSNALYVFGGRTADGLSDAVYRSKFGEGATPTLTGWEEVTAVPLPEPRADATAIAIGDSIFVLGGEGPDGVSASVFRLDIAATGDPVTNEETGGPNPWAIAQPGPAQLPQPRAGAAGIAQSGALYMIGGLGADGAPQATTYWATVDTVTNEVSRWNELPDTNLPEPRARPAVAAVGSFAFLVGGEGPEGPVDDAARANLSPELPFFRLGLFGATIPALSIKGEIGQQLGYMMAGGAGALNFIILLGIGWAFSHRDRSLRLLERVSRGRIRAPREDDYFPDRR